ncbi:MAG: hypothetical protein II680_06605 [Clostridia bacterium]|nr:hypothetical protein [Clostridia bacterium]
MRLDRKRESSDLDPAVYLDLFSGCKGLDVPFDLFVMEGTVRIVHCGCDTVQIAGRRDLRRVGQRQETEPDARVLPQQRFSKCLREADLNSRVSPLWQMARFCGNCLFKAGRIHPVKRRVRSGRTAEHGKIFSRPPEDRAGIFFLRDAVFHSAHSFNTADDIYAAGAEEGDVADAVRDDPVFFAEGAFREQSSVPVKQRVQVFLRPDGKVDAVT